MLFLFCSVTILAHSLCQYTPNLFWEKKQKQTLREACLSWPAANNAFSTFFFGDISDGLIKNNSCFSLLQRSSLCVSLFRVIKHGCVGSRNKRASLYTVIINEVSIYCQGESQYSQICSIRIFLGASSR